MFQLPVKLHSVHFQLNLNKCNSLEELVLVQCVEICPMGKCYLQVWIKFTIKHKILEQYLIPVILLYLPLVV